jgi:predicted nucleic acid-binding protein
MKRLAKWSGLVAAVAAGTMVGMQVIAAVRRRLTRSLGQMERVAEDARQAMEKTAEALRHTEDALRETRRSVS